MLLEKEREKEKRLKSAVMNVIEKEEALERAQVAQVAAVDSFKLQQNIAGLKRLALEPKAPSN